MLKTRIYIFQFLGILVLVCGYLFSNRPDSLSVMHFDPSGPAVISKPGNGGLCAMQTISEEQHNKQRTNVSKHISFELLLPCRQANRTNLFK